MLRNFLKTCFSMRGRVSRRVFVKAWLFVFVLVGIVTFLGFNEWLWWIPALLVVPITVKRLHDIDLTGTYTFIIYQIYILLFFKWQGIQQISIYNYNISLDMLTHYMLWPTGAMLFYLAIKKGSQGTNRYGINPAWAYEPRVPLAEFLSWRGIALKIGEKHK